MVQATVWNQVLSSGKPQQQQNYSNEPSNRGIPPQPPHTSCHVRDRPFRTEHLLPTTIEPPDDDMGTRILDAYLTRLHVRYPFLDRAELWRLHRERWRLAKVKREELSKAERFGIFKLYLVYAIGATLIRLSENYTHVPPEVSTTSCVELSLMSASDSILQRFSRLPRCVIHDQSRISKR